MRKLNKYKKKERNFKKNETISLEKCLKFLEILKFLNNPRENWKIKRISRQMQKFLENGTISRTIFKIPRKPNILLNFKKKWKNKKLQNVNNFKKMKQFFRKFEIFL